jgi:DNA-binding IclR family transcriptional regulator
MMTNEEYLQKSFAESEAAGYVGQYKSHVWAFRFDQANRQHNDHVTRYHHWLADRVDRVVHAVTLAIVNGNTVH